MKSKVFTSGLAIATATVAMLWTLASIVTWRGLVNGPRVGSPWTTNDFGQHLLLEGGVQRIAIIGVLALHLAAAVLGYGMVIRPIWSKRRLCSEIWLVLAGLIPGSLIVIALSRSVTLLVSNSWAPWIIFALTAGGAVYFLIRFAVARDDPANREVNWTAIASVAVVLIAVLVYSVHLDRFHVVGEASVWFMNEVYLSGAHGIGSEGRWPLISQHYDEAALLYPVIYGLMHQGVDASGTFTAIYWIMLALGRVGVGSLLYIAIRSLGVDRLSCLVLLAFVCCASLSLNPFSSRLLFDSLSPLAYGLHIARFLTPVLPFVMVAMFANLEDRATAGGVAIAATLGMGLSAMPVHVMLVLPWGAAIALLTAASPGAGRSPAVRQAGTIISLVVLTAFTLTYSSAGLLSTPARVAMLLGASLVGGLVLLQAWLRTAPSLQPAVLRSAPFVMVLALCCGYAIGILFLGNVLITKTLPYLAHVWPWQGMSISERAVSTLASSSWGLAQTSNCVAGYSWGFRTVTGHCGSTFLFIRTYGLPFVVMALVMVWWSSANRPRELLPERQLTMILFGIALCLLAMPIGFFAYDFLSPADASFEGARILSVWLRSRLVEPWFYSGILFATALFLREASDRARRWSQSIMMIAVVVFGLSSLVIPSQLIANFAYLFAALTAG